MSNINCLNEFFDDIANLPRKATAEQIEAWKSMSPTERAPEVAKSCLRLVVSIAKRYQGRGLPTDELVGLGLFGLVKGAPKYDPDKGIKPSTYMTWWIKQAIKRGLVDTAQTVRIPSYLRAKVSKWKLQENEFEERTGRKPSLDELSEVCGIEPKQRQAFEKAFSICTGQQSLENMVGEDNSETIFSDERFTDPMEQAETNELAEKVQRYLDKLPRTEATIIKKRYGIGYKPMTLQEIGDQIGKSRERVRQIEAEGLNRLKAILTGKRVKTKRNYTKPKVNHKKCSKQIEAPIVQGTFANLKYLVTETGAELAEGTKYDTIILLKAIGEDSEFLNQLESLGQLPTVVCNQTFAYHKGLVFDICHGLKKSSVKLLKGAVPFLKPVQTVELGKHETQRAKDIHANLSALHEIEYAESLVPGQEFETKLIGQAVGHTNVGVRLKHAKLEEMVGYANKATYFREISRRLAKVYPQVPDITGEVAERLIARRLSGIFETPVDEGDRIEVIGMDYALQLQPGQTIELARKTRTLTKLGITKKGGYLTYQPKVLVELVEGMTHEQKRNFRSGCIYSGKLL